MDKVHKSTTCSSKPYEAAGSEEETKVKPEAPRPVIKTEVQEDVPPHTSPPIFEVDDEDINEEVEGLLADQEGVHYYVDAGFKIKQVTNPVIVQRSLNDLFVLSRTKYLKLDPEYQRDVVWDETRASGLIASIIQGYFIPPIIFNVTSRYEPVQEGSKKKILRHYRICVDGKQRLTSVQNFMEGRIGVADSCTPPKKWFYCHPIINGVQKTSNHNILPESTKNFFRSRTFCCYEYDDLPESVEENMFQLVQRGMPLTPAERMRALSTNWANFAKQYEEDYPMVINLSKQTRASGFRAVITIFSQILEVMHPSGFKRPSREGSGSAPTLQAAPQALTRLLLDGDSLNEAVKAKFKEVFDKFQELVELCSEKSSNSNSSFKIIINSPFDPAPDYLRGRGVGHVRTFSPLELLSTAILLLVHGDSRTTSMLMADIKGMRIYIRKHHKDLRLNNLCWATVWRFIDLDIVKPPGDEGAVPRNDPPAAEAEGSGDELQEPSSRARLRSNSGSIGAGGISRATRSSEMEDLSTSSRASATNGVSAGGPSLTRNNTSDLQISTSNMTPSEESHDDVIGSLSSAQEDTLGSSRVLRRQQIPQTNGSSRQLFDTLPTARQVDAESESRGPDSRIPESTNSRLEGDTSSEAMQTNNHTEDIGEPIRNIAGSASKKRKHY